MIIAGYSGIGKTYYADHTEGVLDFHIVPYKYRFPEGYDPSTYTEADKARNDLEFDPDYPTLYCHDLIKYKDEYEHVVIPSDPRVLALLKRFEIPYLLVPPRPDDPEVKAEYDARFMERGNNMIFRNLFIGQWDERLGSLIEKFGPAVYLRKKDYLSDLMLIIDTAISSVSVTSAFLAKFAGVTRASGDPYDESDWRASCLGKTGTLAFLKASADQPEVACFMIGTTHYIQTSPGKIAVEGDTASIKTKSSIYTWRLDSPALPECMHKSIRENFVMRNFI